MITGLNALSRSSYYFWSFEPKLKVRYFLWKSGNTIIQIQCNIPFLKSYFISEVLLLYFYSIQNVLQSKFASDFEYGGYSYNFKSPQKFSWWNMTFSFIIQVLFHHFFSITGKDLRNVRQFYHFLRYQSSSLCIPKNTTHHFSKMVNPRFIQIGL